VVAEHAPEGAFIEVDDPWDPIGCPSELFGRVRVEGFDHSVAGHLLGRGDPREGFAHCSLEQMLSESIGDGSASGDLGMLFPGGAAAVPAPKPPLVP
jgi:hypothetical protein